MQNNQLEDRILQELRARVLEKDLHLSQERERHEMRQATIAALAEMTSLPEEEIDRMAEQVHNELVVGELQKKQRTLQIYMIASFAMAASCLALSLVTGVPMFWIGTAAGAAGGLFFQKKMEGISRPRRIIIDNFDDKKYRWSQNDKLLQKRRIDSGTYVFEVFRQDWCYWNAVKLDLPESFVLTVRSTWVKGVYGDYGPVLLDDDGNYLVGEINGKGEAAYSIYKDKKWAVNKTKKPGMAHPGHLKTDNEQTLIVEGKSMRYLVNDKLVYSGSLEALGKLVRCGLRVCDQQEVHFKRIQVQDHLTGQLILDEGFTQPHEDWIEKEDFEYKKYYQDGNYIIESARDDWNFWSKHETDILGDFDLTLKVRWLRGEAQLFGIVIYQSQQEYYIFGLKPDGTASCDLYRDNKFERSLGSKETVHTSNGAVSHFLHLRKREKQIAMYINETYVLQTDFEAFRINQIGVLASGHQVIQFEKLVIEER